MEKFKIEFKWASIFTAINLIWVYIEKYLGLHDKYIDYHSIVGLVILIPFSLCILMSIRQKREEYYKGDMTWQKAFLSGALLSLVVAGLSAGPVYVMSEYVSPDFFEIAKSKSLGRGATEEMVKQFFNLNAYISQAIMFYLAFGVMISALIGLVVKRKSSAV
jgi:RsiW-degrading membrane proteinase PrsW (M82 family)